MGEVTRGLEEEIEAFAFVLPILEFEIRKSIQPLVGRGKDYCLGWKRDKDFQSTQGDSRRNPSPEISPAECARIHRSTQYDTEIQHLRRCIATYIDALKIHVYLLVVQVMSLTLKTNN